MIRNIISTKQGKEQHKDRHTQRTGTHQTECPSRRGSWAWRRSVRTIRRCWRQTVRLSSTASVRCGTAWRCWVNYNVEQHGVATLVLLTRYEISQQHEVSLTWLTWPKLSVEHRLPQSTLVHLVLCCRLHLPPPVLQSCCPWALYLVQELTYNTGCICINFWVCFRRKHQTDIQQLI